MGPPTVLPRPGPDAPADKAPPAPTTPWKLAPPQVHRSLFACSVLTHIKRLLEHDCSVVPVTLPGLTCDKFTAPPEPFTAVFALLRPRSAVCATRPFRIATTSFRNTLGSCRPSALTCHPWVCPPEHTATQPHPNTTAGVAQRSMRSTSASSMYSPELPAGPGDDGLAAGARLTPLKQFLADFEGKQRLQEEKLQCPAGWAAFGSVAREPVCDLRCPQSASHLSSHLPSGLNGPACWPPRAFCRTC